MVSSTVLRMDFVTPSAVSLIGVGLVSLLRISAVLFLFDMSSDIASTLAIGALAQVMQRLNLNWLANPVQGVPPNTFTTIFSLMAAFLVCDLVLTLAMQAVLPQDNSTNPTGDIPTSFYVFSFLRNSLKFAFFLYGIIITIKTRYYIRNKYAIRAQDCGESLEDCCCSFWCHGCTICQMARHTADYDTYSARCCSSTGLGPNAPAIV
jgi:Cys-rich protein (TIGR01571 family)